MKKHMTVLFFVLLAGTLFSGCTTTEPVQTPFDISVEYETDTPVVTLDIMPIWTENQFIDDDKGFSRFICNFRNNTEGVAKIVWEESGIVYGGDSTPLMIDGQKYIDSTTPMTPTIIPKGNTIHKEVISSEQANYSSGKYGGWHTEPIPNTEVMLLFCVRTDKGDEYITAKVKVLLVEEKVSSRLFG